MTNDLDAACPAIEGRGGWRRLVADRSVRTKILGAVGALAVVSVAVGGIAINEINGLDQDTSAVADVTEGISYDRALVDADQVRARLLVAEMALADGSDKQAIQAQLHDVDAEVEAAIGKVNAAGGPRVMPSWPDFVAGWQHWQEVRDSALIPAAASGDVAAFQTATVSQSQPAVDAYQAALAKAEDELRAEVGRLAHDADSGAAASRVVIIVALLVGLALASLLAVAVAAGITRSLRRVQVALTAMAAGDLTARAKVGGGDEIGRMAADLALAQESVRSVVEQVARSSEAVSSSSEELSAASTQIAAGAEETSAQAGVVAAAAEQVSHNVQTVATGSEEMSASIREISQSTTDAARVAHEAVGVVDAANGIIAQLDGSSNQIGAVVKVITTIADQTNLLALNATIEAARAGEAGKGFAVVAGEVKELAQETARATGDIAARVEAIQSDSRAAAEAMTRVSEIIAAIDGYQITIASAVEEQTATTSEMSRNVSEAAGGSGQIAENIVGVASASASTAEAVAQSRIAIDELARLAADLNDEVTRFTY